MMLDMTGEVVGRADEMAAVERLLAEARTSPAGLVLDGDAGIGRTTIWRAAIARAAAMGFTVLMASGAPTEVAMAFAGLADVLAGVGQTIFDSLVPLHRRALAAVLGGDPRGENERLVGAAFAGVLDRLSQHSTVLIAIDDAQWLDDASRLVLGFNLRRLVGPVAVLATTRRGDPAHPDDLSWLQLPDPHDMARMTVAPMSLGALQSVLVGKLGRTFPRPTMVRIHALSGGNPFFALELARAVTTDPDVLNAALPPTLASIVHRWIGELDPETAQVLLTVAEAADPTVATIAAATGHDAEHVVTLLEPLESSGVLSFEGSRIRFSHPLSAAGISTLSPPPQRRAVHRRLAQTTDDPELRARHLALGSPYGDADTLAALDVAAEVARGRGAPATAAELIDLAIALGGDNPTRRLLSAAHHFRAGDIARARAVAEVVVAGETGLPHVMAVNVVAAAHIYDNSYVEAAALLTSVLHEATAITAVHVQTLLSLAMAEGMSGQFEPSLRHAADAVDRARESGLAGMESQALSMRTTLECAQGYGLDTVALQRALDLEGTDSDVPVPFSARAVSSLLAAWTGNLESARTQMAEVAAVCEERDAETEMMWVDAHRTFIDVWLGRYVDAANTAADLLRRAEQLGGDNTFVIAALIQAAVAAHTGQEDLTRHWADVALTRAQNCSAQYLTDWPLMSLGLLEVSLGNYPEAVKTLEPLLARFDITPGTELFTSSHLPDAIEALINTGQSERAVPLIEALESNGAQLDRAWMLAGGAHGRAQLLAAHGDLAGAEDFAHRALAEYGRLPMPLPRARTLLLLGQLQRRQRRRQQAAATFSEAAAIFDSIGSTQWSLHAHAELARLATRSKTDTSLTGAEMLVAQNVAAGQSNKEVAATLHMAPKTVEMHLSRIYRKLGIRSRGQLAARLRANQ